MADVPAPGQTQTTGTWTPGPPQGQNQDLRAKLGLGVPRPQPVPQPKGFALGCAKVQRLAQGGIVQSPDNQITFATPLSRAVAPAPVPAPAPASAPAPTYDPSIAAQARQRPAVMQPFAQPLTTDPTSRVVLQPWTSIDYHGTGPGDVGASDANPSSPAANADAQNEWSKAMQDLQTGAHPLTKLANTLFGGRDNEIAQAEGAANVYKNPQIQTLMAANPSIMAEAQKDKVGTATKLQQFLNATQAQQTWDEQNVTHTLPTGQTVVAPVDDSDKVNAHARAYGIPREIAHAALEPHNYSKDQFTAAISHLPLSMLGTIWGMQHYLTPEQQLIPQVLQGHADKINEAQQALSAAVTSGDPKKIAAAKTDLTARNAEREAEVKLLAEKGNVPLSPGYGVAPGQSSRP